MSKVFASIDERLAGWIADQAMFFVGTAPLAGDGHVNVSPKGPIGSLAVLGSHRVAYLDVVGSGAETIAHLRENGRIVVMFCAFEGPPRIVRLHGHGEVVTAGDEHFEALIAEAGFEQPTVLESRRAVIDVAVEADRRLMRLRRAVDGLRGRATTSEPLFREANPQLRPGRLRRLPAQAQRGEHRRPARRRGLTAPAT